MITWPQPVIQCRHKIGGTVAVAAALALLGGGTVGPHVIRRHSVLRSRPGYCDG